MYASFLHVNKFDNLLCYLDVSPIILCRCESYHYIETFETDDSQQEWDTYIQRRRKLERVEIE
jgi:hypothetical protein